MIKVQNHIERFQNNLIAIFYYILRIAGSIGISFFLSQCIIFENFSPFSLILLSVSQNIGLIPTFCYLGGTIGVLFNSFDLSTFKYITALTMIYVIYMVFQKSLRIIKHNTAVLTAACCFTSGFLFLLVGQLSLFNVLVLIGESVLICCCIYFIIYASEAFKKNCHLSAKEIIAAVITLILILSALHNVYIINLSVARIVGLILIFLALFCLKTSHTVVLGSCMGIILSTVSNGGESIFMATIIGTLAGCVFSSFSNKLVITSFILVYYATLLFFGQFPWNYWYFAEPLVAFSLTLLVPKKKMRNFLSAYIPVKQEKTLNGQSNNELDEMIDQLDQLSRKIENTMESGVKSIHFLYDKEKQIKKALEERKIDVKEISFMIDEHGCQQCMVCFEPNEEVLFEKIIREIVFQQFERSCSFKIERYSTGYIASFKESALYNVQCAALCKTKNGETVCGDQAIGFSIGKNKYYLILSDGMGSGKQAGIYSEMITSALKRLIRSGLSETNALSLFRSVIRFNQNETFSTLDLCALDLDQGVAEFYKGGAFDSYLLHNDQCLRIQGGGIPLGLSEKDHIQHEAIQFSDNDYLIMASDGLFISKEEIKLFFDSCKNDDVKLFAKNILRKYIEENASAGNDDITIMVCRFYKT